MKKLLTFTAFIGFVSFCSAQAKGDSKEWALILGGRNIFSNDSVSKDDLRDICGVEVLEVRAGKRFHPIHLEWVISNKGQIWKGECPVKSSDVTKYNEVLAKATPGAILFIDEIPSPYSDKKVGQFAFKIK